MERDKFLKLCQAAAYQTRGSSQLSERWRNGELVRYRGTLYIPMSYEMRFHDNGSIIHAAHLKGIRGNYEVLAPLSEVEETGG